MNLLIKKEVLKEYSIETSQLLLGADNFEVFIRVNTIEVELLYKIKWKRENDTIIIYKEKKLHA